MQRRLAAILMADVVGYSRLMGEDEAATLAALNAHRHELIEPKARQYRGRIAKWMGDGLLMEFASVVEAAHFAIDVQGHMRTRQAKLDPTQQIIFRIGINLGDVIVEGDDLYGDGVNVAARLEAQASPGGIVLSRSARDQIRDRLVIGLEDMGEVEVKNIVRPVRVFRVVLDERAESLITPIVSARAAPRMKLRLAAVLAIVLLAAIAGISGWAIRPPATPSASAERMAWPLPDRPSIAVLPFAELGGDPEERYFAEGITEDIITDLSKVPGLFVIARNSTFAYRGGENAIRDVAEALGVRYVLIGSLRRAGEAVRINATLVDALSGEHLWAERYDGGISDVFRLQDSVTAQIVGALSAELGPSRPTGADPDETADAEAYDAFLRGWAYYRQNTPEAFLKALPHLERALALDPDYVRAHATLAAIYWQAAEDKEKAGHPGLWIATLGLTYDETRERGQHHLERAMEDPTPLALQVLSSVKARQGRHDEAIAVAKRALALDPNDPIGHEALAKALIYAGRASEAVEVIERAIRFDPVSSGGYLAWLGVAQFGEGRFHEAGETLRRSLIANPEQDVAMIVLVAALGHLGANESAEAVYADLNAIRQRRERQVASSGDGVEAGVDRLLVGPYTLRDVDFWPYAQSEDRERLRRGLRLAGVPKEDDIAVSPLEVPGATSVDVAMAHRLFEAGAQFVDVRSEEIWKLGRIPGAVLLDLKAGFTEARLAEVVGRDDPVVIYCEGPKCLRSSQACALAVEWGFSNVHYFRGGFPSWKAAGHRVEAGDD